MKILFLGSPLFAKEVLQKLLESSHKVVGVVCQPDSPSGRGHKLTPPQIKPFALENNIKVYQFDKIKLHLDEIFAIDFDVFVVASFGQILPREFFERGKIGINVHPSMLPKYRGATPLQTAILNGDKTTGVTIMKMGYEVDAGDICCQKEIEIGDKEFYTSLEHRCALLGGEMLVNCLDKLEKNQANFTPQCHEKATFTKMIKSEDRLLDFNNKAEDIVNKVRAISENWGTYFFLGDDRIKVFDAGIEKNFENTSCGEIIEAKNKFTIKALDFAVNILTLSSPSGKKLKAKDFLNGYKFKTKRVNENVT